VLLDFSNVPSDRRDFPVLFPTVDTLNHNPSTPIEWSFDPGRFTLRTLTPNLAGAQIYNNYGPKANGELLMGYGFCLPTNTHDGVLETLKPPPEPLQRLLRKSHPGYFKTNGSWNSEAATFHLRAPPFSTSTNPADVWTSIPDPLIELFYYITRLERGLPVIPIDTTTSSSDQNPSTNDALIHDHLFSGPGQSYLPRIAFAIVTSLVPKMNKISTASANLHSSTPRNNNQRNAQIYRDGQMEIMSSIREGLSAFNRSLRPPLIQNFTGSAIWSLDEVLAVMKREDGQAGTEFLDGVGLGESDLEGIRGGPVEQRIWVLWVCYVTILAGEGREGLLSRWIASLGEEYGEPFDEEGEDEDEAAPFMRVVKGAAEDSGEDSVWRSRHWSSGFVLDWGMRVVTSQGMMMRIAGGDVRFVVYLHVQA